MDEKMWTTKMLLDLIFDSEIEESKSSKLLMTL
jgi:hypothetical protein